MIYYDNLWNQVIEKPPVEADEFKVLSGFVGPTPIQALHNGVNAKLKCTVIFGLFKENRKAILHDELTKLNNENVQILYPNLPAHSKCYVWLSNGIPIRGLIGSANFSANGLRIPYRESLIEVKDSDIKALNTYIELIRRTCRVCTEVDRSELQERKTRYLVGEDTDEFEEGVAKLSLIDRSGEVPALSGLNWGMSPTSHVNIDDAYIPIRKEVIKNHPELFPPRPIFEGANTRGSLDEVVELIWDDGIAMQVKFEGTQNLSDSNGDVLKFPKQISSFPIKAIMGRYLRARIGVPSGVVVTREDLERYGNTTIQLSMISEGVYSASFAPGVSRS